MTSGPPPDDAELSRLRAELGYLRAIVRCAGDIVIATDADGRITEFSEGAVRALGYAKSEVVGRPVASLYIDQGLRPKLIARLAERRGEPLLDQEVAVRRKDGKKIWLSCSLAELRDQAGR